MRLLDRYITKAVLAAIGLVTLSLSVLQIFILLVNQLGDIGRGDFGLSEAIIFVLLQTPYQVYLFFPVATLLGALIGLGIMANHSELIVMQTSGMSITQITFAVLKSATILIILVTGIGELIIPKIIAYSKNRQMQMFSEGQTLRTAKGIWLRYHNDFININVIKKDNILEKILQFHFNKEHHLKMVRQIERVVYQKDHWQADGIHQTRFRALSTHSDFIAHMVWNIPVKPSLLQLSRSEPDEMTLFELHQYLSEQKQQHQITTSYPLAYWQRLLQPLSTLVMMLLAIPFIFGPLRTSSMGIRFLTGAFIGFSFHILNHLFGALSQVYQWPPLIAATTPIIFFMFLGLYFTKKERFF